MLARFSRPIFIGCVALVMAAASSPAHAQTYRKIWTTTADFNEGVQVNVNATVVPDQLQLNLGQLETPYLWIANSGDSTVSRIDTATGRVLSVTEIPRDPSGESVGPSRTAVDLNFDCWVALRSTANGFVYKLSAETGEILGRSSFVGSETRGVAINSRGEVWVSSSRLPLNGDAYGWSKIDPDPTGGAYLALERIESDIGSYGLAIDPFGKIYSTTAWLPVQGTASFRSIQRVDSDSGEFEQRWRLTHNEGDIYGITVDIDANVWGAYWPGTKVARINGTYNCPNNQDDCTISPQTTPEAIQEIDVLAILRALDPTLDGDIGGRGIAVDANGFVWAVFNRDAVNWQQSDSFAIKIDPTTNEPILAIQIGQGAVGISPDANGFIWVVNHDGGGANYQNSYTCPNDFDPSTGGTITKLRSSDGSVVATYPTCGRQPYTYSDFGGFALGSVTLRSGSWQVVHDSGRPSLEWERINWQAQEFNDTTFRVRVRAADTQENLSAQPFVTVANNDDMPLIGRYIEVETFFFTRNNFIGPSLEDIAVSSVCVPAAEVCDGIDNNCDGNIDEGNPGGGQACTTGANGVCSEGINTCMRGQFECLAAVAPTQEICNGLDDNCDGNTDEGVTNRCGECGDVPAEVCDNEDNDCDSEIDEGVLNACGECGPVPVEVCDNEDNNCNGLTDEGVLNACGGCGPVPVEVCDEQDNDCDGLIDEEVANACGDCGPTPVEICNNADDDCDGLVDEELLNACGECGDVPLEVCDGIDNDCDGETDEGLLNACGECGEVATEICDGIDNDCDGETDEGLLNACGNCGELPNESCNGIDDDCDGETDEGVLNACGGCGVLPPEECNGVDDDCDGETDEGTLNACGTCGTLPADTCDGIDNDCDMEVDEEPDCADGRTCVSGQCAEDCAQGECPRGFICVGDFCLLDECIGRECPGDLRCYLGECITPEQWPCRTVECEGDLVCISGDCVEDPCDTTTCDEGETCYQGSCRDDAEVACLVTECQAGEICEEGNCIPDPCMGVMCEVGEVCNMGSCVDACDDVMCGTGFVCTRGNCVEDPCFNVTCDAGQVCDNGNCIWEICVGTVCGAEEQCGPNGCEPVGACGDSVCVENEICFNNACVDPDNPGGSTSNSTSGTTPSDTTPDGGDTAGGGSGSDDGCGCHTVSRPTPTLPVSLLFAVGALAGIWMRRRP